VAGRTPSSSPGCRARSPRSYVTANPQRRRRRAPTAPTPTVAPLHRLPHLQCFLEASWAVCRRHLPRRRSPHGREWSLQACCLQGAFFRFRLGFTSFGGTSPPSCGHTWIHGGHQACLWLAGGCGSFH
jgi:hypothetical protein